MAEVVPGQWIVGVELDRRLVGRFRFLWLPQILQGVAQVDVEEGLARIECDRRLDVLQCQGGISRLMLEHSQVVPGIGMAGLGGEHRLVSEPRFGQLPLLMKADDPGKIRRRTHGEAMPNSRR